MTKSVGSFTHSAWFFSASLCNSPNGYRIAQRLFLVLPVLWAGDGLLAHPWRPARMPPNKLPKQRGKPNMEQTDHDWGFGGWSTLEWLTLHVIDSRVDFPVAETMVQASSWSRHRRATSSLPPWRTQRHRGLRMVAVAAGNQRRSSTNPSTTWYYLG